MTNFLRLVRVITAVIISVTEQVQGNTVTSPALELLRLAVEADLGGTVGLVGAVIAVLCRVTEPALLDTELAVPAEDLTTRTGDVTVSLVRAVMAVLISITEPVLQYTDPVTAGSPSLRTHPGGTEVWLVTPVRAVHVTIAVPGGRDAFPVTTEELGGIVAAASSCSKASITVSLVLPSLAVSRAVTLEV